MLSNEILKFLSEIKIDITTGDTRFIFTVCKKKDYYEFSAKSPAQKV